MSAEIDIVIPVYNEGSNILPVLESFRKSVHTPYRVLICYDRDDDNTLPVVRKFRNSFGSQPTAQSPEPIIEFIKNPSRGPLEAILAGFRATTAPMVLMIAADDDYNAPIIDEMARQVREGAEIVVASRFIRGGYMRDCPWLKAFLVRTSAWALYHVARLPSRDASNGFRMFSRRVIDRIPIESRVGFAYSIELLVKAHRLRWRVVDVAAGWQERKSGRSRFAVIKWLPQYLIWFRYAFATTYLRRGADTVVLK
ncbi:MAG: glycosyltransferase family 2 protein [Gemmatimonadaceae bacterium]